MKTYPTGYAPNQEATLLGAKSYRNANGLFIHLSRNIVVQGGLFADNVIGIDIDKDDAIRVVGAKVIGESDSFRNLMLAKKLDKQVCNSPHIGIELHTELRTAKDTGIAISDVVFSGFGHIPCSDAVPFSMDSSVR
jgi:hypothetical protein